MNIRAARDAIEAILAAIPDNELPAFDKIEKTKDRTVAWWGGHGHHLGTAKRNGERRPLNYRESASWDAIEGEMAYRADRDFLASGDGAS